MAGDPRKQSLYLPGNLLEEMLEEAARLDRSLSWVVQAVWKLGKERLKAIPGVTPDSATWYTNRARGKLVKLRKDRDRR